MAKSKLPEETQIELSAKFVTRVKEIAKSELPLDGLAIQQNVIPELQDLIKQGADVNHQIDIPGEKGNAALHYLVQAKSEELVNFFVKNLQCNVNIQNMRQVTPLHESVSCVNLEASRSLIENSADVNSINRRGETPLHLLLQFANQNLPNFLSLCELLMNNKANPLQSHQNRDRPVDYLLSNLEGLEDNNLKEISKHLLCTSGEVQKNHTDLVELVINHFIKPESQNKNIILNMIGYLVKELAERGEKISIEPELFNQMAVQVDQNYNSQNAILEQLKQISNIASKSDLLTPVLVEEKQSANVSSVLDDNVILSGVEDQSGNVSRSDKSLAGEEATTAKGGCDLI